MDVFAANPDAFRTSPERQPSLTYYANNVTKEAECNGQGELIKLGVVSYTQLGCTAEPDAYVRHYGR
jgi:hypothetical protein